MSVEDFDLQAHTQERISGHLALSVRFRAVVTAIVAGFVEVKNALRSIDSMMDIDGQGGVGLDIIGKIIGQPRRLLGAAPRSFYGFRIDGPGAFQRALTYGDRAHTERGGLMWGRGQVLTGSALMTDPDYRFAIRARIVKNNTKPDGVTPWIERIYQVLLLILPDGANHAFPLFALNERMVITICIGRPVSAREVALLTQADLIPVPNTMQLRFTQWDDSLSVFGFAGQSANVAGFGDRAHASWGGRFAERISQNVAA
jgi:Protein of unknown function (DUF2612)